MKEGVVDWKAGQNLLVGEVREAEQDVMPGGTKKFEVSIEERGNSGFGRVGCVSIFVRRGGFGLGRRQ